MTGGCYREHDHHSIGSGSLFARGSMKKLWRPGIDADAAVRVAVEGLYDAADDDSATGGPDLGRRIWPTVAVVDSRACGSSPSRASPPWSNRWSPIGAATPAATRGGAR